MKGLSGVRRYGGTEVRDYQAFKEEQYDKLADHVRKYVDMERIYEILREA